MTTRRAALLLVLAFLSAACGREAEDRAAETPGPTATPCVLEGGTENTVSVQADHAEPAPGIALLSEVRFTEEGCPTVAFVFENASPSYQLGYQDPPFSECGSGDRIPTSGWGASAYLVFHSDEASGVDLSGAEFRQTYDGDADIDVGSPILRRIRRTCDFEATIEWVIALDERRPYEDGTVPDAPGVLVTLDASA